MKKTLSIILLISLFFSMNTVAFAINNSANNTGNTRVIVTTNKGDSYDLSNYITVNYTTPSVKRTLSEELIETIDYTVDIPYDILYHIASVNYADDEGYEPATGQSASFSATIRAVFKNKEALNSSNIMSKGKYINRIEYKYSCPLYNTSVNSAYFRARSVGTELETGNFIDSQDVDTTISGFTVAVMSNYATAMNTGFNKYIHLTDSVLADISGKAVFNVQLGTESVNVEILADIL